MEKMDAIQGESEVSKEASKREVTTCTVRWAVVTEGKCRREDMMDYNSHLCSTNKTFALYLFTTETC